MTSRAKREARLRLLKDSAAELQDLIMELHEMREELQQEYLELLIPIGTRVVLHQRCIATNQHMCDFEQEEAEGHWIVARVENEEYILVRPEKSSSRTVELSRSWMHTCNIFCITVLGVD